MRNTDTPAMPYTTWDNEVDKVIEQGNGLTKREMFAMHAMNGYLSMLSNHGNAIDCDKLAKKSVSYADALLKELEK